MREPEVRVDLSTDELIEMTKRRICRECGNAMLCLDPIESLMRGRLDAHLQAVLDNLYKIEALENELPG